jgi:hypothetical protein
LIGSLSNQSDEPHLIFKPQAAAMQEKAARAGRLPRAVMTTAVVIEFALRASAASNRRRIQFNPGAGASSSSVT